MSDRNAVATSASRGSTARPRSRALEALFAYSECLLDRESCETQDQVLRDLKADHADAHTGGARRLRCDLRLYRNGLRSWCSVMYDAARKTGLGQRRRLVVALIPALLMWLTSPVFGALVHHFADTPLAAIVLLPYDGFVVNLIVLLVLITLDLLSDDGLASEVGDSDRLRD